MERWAAKPGPITPVAGVGEHILVRRVKNYYMYRVLYREGLPPSAPLMRDFGAVAAAATTAGVSLQTPLEMDDFHLGQFRVKVLEDIRLTIWQPRSIGRFQTKNIISQITKFTEIVDPCGHMTELFTFEDEWPFVDINNPTDYNLAVSRVLFYGFKYVLDKVGEYTEAQLPGISQPYTAVIGEGY